MIDSPERGGRRHISRGCIVSLPLVFSSDYLHSLIWQGATLQIFIMIKGEEATCCTELHRWDNNEVQPNAELLLPPLAARVHPSRDITSLQRVGTRCPFPDRSLSRNKTVLGSSYRHPSTHAPRTVTAQPKRIPARQTRRFLPWNYHRAIHVQRRSYVEDLYRSHVNFLDALPQVG